jgi:hypothetical protein
LNEDDVVSVNEDDSISSDTEDTPPSAKGKVKKPKASANMFDLLLDDDNL